MDHELFTNSVNTDQISQLLDIFALLPFCTHSLNKNCGTTHWVIKIFWRTAVCVAILPASLYQKSLEVGMNCVYQFDIWIYPVQICRTKSHIVMLYTDSCFRLSTSWFLCRSKTPSENFNKVIYRYFLMREISLLWTTEYAAMVCSQVSK